MRRGRPACGAIRARNLRRRNIVFRDAVGYGGTSASGADRRVRVQDGTEVLRILPAVSEVSGCRHQRRVRSRRLSVVRGCRRSRRAWTHRCRSDLVRLSWLYRQGLPPTLERVQARAGVASGWEKRPCRHRGHGIGRARIDSRGRRQPAGPVAGSISLRNQRIGVGVSPLLVSKGRCVIVDQSRYDVTKANDVSARLISCQ